jgi:hypothetical protein
MAYSFTAASSQYLFAGATTTAVPITLACWFYPNNTTANMILIDLSNSSGNNRFTLAALGGLAGDPIRVDAISGTGAAADTTTGFASQSWQHACGVFSANNARSVYLNAGSQGSSTASVTPSGIDRTFAGTRSINSVAGLFMDGRLAECGIWNAALTAAEIASLAKGMTCDKVRPQSLVFYAPLVRDLVDQKGGLAISNNNSATVAAHPRVYA